MRPQEGKPLPVEIRCRGVLFDMDGVLIDSTGADERTWRRWATLRGLGESFSMRSTHGRRALDTLRALRPDLDPAEEIRVLEQLDTGELAGVLPLPGVPGLLASIPESQRAVVTSASTQLMRNRLQAAGLALPQHAVAADHVTHGKPHPEPYLSGAALLGFAPAECLVIEDAPAGIASARAAGCRVLGVLTSHGAADLKHADWLVSSLAELRAACHEDGWIDIRFDMHAGD
jgi:sugar-phosphatase